MIVKMEMKLQKYIVIIVFKIVKNNQNWKKEIHISNKKEKIILQI